MIESMRPLVRLRAARVHASLWGLAALLFGTPALAQPTLGNLAFDQVDWFGTQVPAIIDSEWGRFSLDITPGANTEFINVLANAGGSDAWIVRNLPSIPSSADPATQRFSTLFDLGLLGISRGVDITSLDYLLTVDATPRATAPPSGSMTTVAVGSVVIDAQGRETGEGPLREPGSPAPLAALMFTDHPVEQFWHADVPNIDLDDAANNGDFDGCGPAAAANSLKWLGAPDPLRTVFDDLSADMGRSPGSTVTDGQFFTGKLKYIHDQGFGLDVKYQSDAFGGLDINTPYGKAKNRGTKPTFQFIMDEIAADEDVELGMTFFRCTECVEDGNEDMVPDIDAGQPCELNIECDALAPGDLLGKCMPVGAECDEQNDCPVLSQCRAAGGHWVNVVGTIAVGGAHGIWTKDDADQEGAGGTQTQFSWLWTRADGFLEAIPSFARHRLDIVVSESPSEAPALGARGLVAVALLVVASGWLLVRRAGKARA